MQQTCPCNSHLPYAECCQSLHQGQPAKNATQLMRSRYSAYVLQLADYLRSSWHVSTRPEDFTADDLDGMTWLGLTIVDAADKTATKATVTFKARFSIEANDATQTLHETSRFIRENGHWYYVDGVIH